MAVTRISGNQIATSTQAIITTLSFLNTNSIFRLPSGDTASRPTGVSVGTIRFNSQEDSAEIYKADDGTGSAGWTEVAGGGPSVGNDAIIRTNGVTLTEATTVGPTANGDEKFTHGFHFGTLTLGASANLTVENGAGLQIVATDKLLAYQSDINQPGRILQVVKGSEVVTGNSTPLQNEYREINTAYRTTFNLKSTNPQLKVTWVCNGELDGTMPRTACRFYASVGFSSVVAYGRPMFFGSPNDTDIQQAASSTVTNMFPVTAVGGSEVTVTIYWSSENDATGSNINFGQTWSQFGNVPMASFLIVEEIAT